MKLKGLFSLFLCLFCLLCSFCSCKKSSNSSSEYRDVSVISKTTSGEDGTGSTEKSEGENKTDSSTTESGKVSSSSPSSSSESTKSEKKEFKYEYEMDPAMYKYSSIGSGNPSRVANALRKASSGQKITVAFIGGSITEGSGASASKCYAALVVRWLKNKFGSDNVNYINAGIGTAGSFFGVHRVDKDVIAHNPDIVFTDFAVNDKGKDEELEISCYDALVQKLYNCSSKPAVISLAMVTKDGWNTEANEYEICKFYGIPMLSYNNVLKLRKVEKN